MHFFNYSNKLIIEMLTRHVIAIGEEDYESLSSSTFGPQLNFTDEYRHQCFNVIIIDDDISEQIESFHVVLDADSLSASLSLDLLPRNTIINIVDDDGKDYRLTTRLLQV